MCYTEIRVKTMIFMGFEFLHTFVLGTCKEDICMYICMSRIAVRLTQQLLNVLCMYTHVGGSQWKVKPDSHYLITHHQSRKNSISPHHIFVQLAQVLVTEITSPCDLVFQKCCFNRLLPQSAVVGLTISHWKKRWLCFSLHHKSCFIEGNIRENVKNPT